MPSSPFVDAPLAPRDPIFGVTEAFNADQRTTKVNLGVGVYLNAEGKIPVMAAVREAELARAKTALPRGYLPIDGIAAYDDGIKALLFGAESDLRKSGRLVTAQALGGTGALKIGADLLHRLHPDATVMISDPSWENHRALYEAAGFKVVTYPYYDPSTHGVDFAGMLAALQAAAPGTIVVLHACCHNPTGVDLSAEQWHEVVSVVTHRNLVAQLDFAYQGFGSGIEADGLAVKLFVESGLEFLVANSFSKSFSLYGERVGGLSIVTNSAEEAGRVLSQLKRAIRANYSNPPTHGGSVVAAVLGDRRLRGLWEEELGQMRERIKAMRQGLVAKLAQRKVARDFSFVLRQHGMFSYSGLTQAQVERLREQFGVYALPTGRICLAALNERNLDYVCDSIAEVSWG